MIHSSNRAIAENPTRHKTRPTRRVRPRSSWDFLSLRLRANLLALPIYLVFDKLRGSARKVKQFYLVPSGGKYTMIWLLPEVAKHVQQIDLLRVEFIEGFAPA